MSTSFNTPSPLVERVKGGYTIKFNIQSYSYLDEFGEDINGYKFDVITVKEIHKERLIQSFIRAKYSIDEELRHNRVRDAEFDIYNAWCKDAIYMAKILVKETPIDGMSHLDLDDVAMTFGMPEYPKSEIKQEKINYLKAQLGL